MENQLITGDIWKNVNHLLKKDKTQRKACIAYVTSLQLNLKKDDVLICDASDTSIKSGRTSAKAIKDYFDRGVVIYSNSHLHSKFLVTEQFLTIGSANLSNNSVEHLIETSLILSNPRSIAQSKVFFHKLLKEEKTTIRVDEIYIERILKLKVDRKTRRGTKRPKILDLKLGESCWYLNTYPLGDKAEQLPKHENAIIIKEAAKEYGYHSQDISSIRWSKESTMGRTAKIGDRILVRWQNKEGTRSIVYPPSIILKRVVKGKFVYFYRPTDELHIVSFTNFIKSLSAEIRVSYTFRRNCKLKEEVFNEISKIW
jgi:hypothetical protein